MKRNSVPHHVAIIMDGNGRWAKERNMPRSFGHLQGVKRVDEILNIANELGVKILTLFAFSSENWNRPKKEISLLLNALVSNLNKKAHKLGQENIKFQVLGRRDGVPKKVLESFETAEKKTKNNTGLIFNIAFNYGSRQEIVDAVRKISLDVKKGTLKADDISEEVVSKALYTAGMPDPDLLIRTSGEKRISNFLLWQLSYSELYFTSKYWPEFNRKEFEKAILDFQGRERRFGAVKHKKDKAR